MDALACEDVLKIEAPQDLKALDGSQGYGIEVLSQRMGRALTPFDWLAARAKESEHVRTVCMLSAYLFDSHALARGRRRRRSDAAFPITWNLRSDSRNSNARAAWRTWVSEQNAVVCT